MNKLDQLRKMTVIVADTGDIESIEQYKPTDATTNPSLLYKAAQQPQYEPLVRSAIEYGRSKSTCIEELTKFALDKLSVNFGVEILKTVPGRVSTEVDSRLSFDTRGTITCAQKLMELYSQASVDPARILIKVASTWEGIKAAEQLEKQGIHCNLTLLFGFAQAVACADAGITLISPFVGRILDWYKKAKGVEGYAAEKDPGVLSVTSIYNYYKRHGYETVVMGASFRNTDEILQLAGCDYLTIAPSLMEDLQNDDGQVEKKLSIETATNAGADKIHLDENKFRWMQNEDAMATEKLAEGIRNFTLDTLMLEKLIAKISQ